MYIFILLICQFKKYREQNGYKLLAKIFSVSLSGAPNDELFPIVFSKAFSLEACC